MNYAIIFFCLLALISAVFMLLSVHPMKMALALVSVMLNLAIIYGLAGAHIVAISQVLIYVGAVMIFMIYVIMLLHIRDSSIRKPKSPYYVLAALLLLLQIFLVYFQFFRQAETNSNPSLQAMGDLLSFKNFSQHFLSEYWLHFELASVLLLVATVSTVSILNFKKEDGTL